MSRAPHGWTVSALHQVTSRPSKTDPASTGRESVRYIDIGLLDGPVDNLAAAPKVAVVRAPSRCRQVVATGDTLYSTVRPYLRKIAYVSGTLDQEFASTGYSVLRANSAIEAKYLYYFCLSPQFEDQILPFQKGVSYPAVLDKEVRAQSIWYPGTTEQRRIVEILDDHLSRLDAADQGLSKTLLRLDALRASLLTSARRGTMTRLSDVSEIQGGIQKQPRRAPRENPYPFLRVANVTANGLDLTDVHQIELFGEELTKLRLARGDLLVVEGNGSASQIGRAALWDGSIEDCVHQNHLIRVRAINDLMPEYLEAVWNSPETRAELTAVASSSSGLHTLSVGKLKRVSIPIPDVAEQRAIVAALADDRAARKRLVDQLRATRIKLSGLRRAVLAAAFSGKLSGHHTDHEVIEEMAQ